MSLQITDNTSNLWMQLMRRGDFEGAWRYSDSLLTARRNKPNLYLPRHFQSIWDGRSLEGKSVLVRCYHGLGDSIQFIRYASLLKQSAREIIVWAQPPLLRLLKTLPEIDRLLPLHDGSPAVDYEVDVEIMELPHVFRTSLSNIPLKIPYLHVDSIRLVSSDDEISVGIVWKAGDWNKHRSVPFSIVAPLAAMKGIKLYILQSCPAAAGWQEGFGEYRGEFTLFQYAQMIKGLDLLITVDSMPAHLAGALGVRVWTMLPYQADWRWMEDRKDSPWYPSMRLYRQYKPGDWEDVIARITEDLKREVSSKFQTQNGLTI